MSFAALRVEQFVGSSLLALSTFSMIHLPIAANAESRRCRAAITDAERRIKAGRPIQVRSQVRDLSEWSSDYPNNRPLKYHFIVRGKAAEAVMTSPQFQISIATNIIKNCDSVSAVDFGMDQTDWGITIGILPGDRIGKFECISPPAELAWGQSFC